MRRIWWGVIAAGLWGLLTPQPSVAASGGTQIVNDASATYTDAAHTTYAVSSNTIVNTVAKVAAITVNPKEAAANPATEGVAVGTTVVRNFVVANSSNIPDSYTVTALTSGTMSVVSLAWVTSGGTVSTTVSGAPSPVVPPGQTIKLQVTLATKGLSVGQTIPVNVTVQTTTADVANGLQSDSGQQWVIAASAPTLVGLLGSAIDKVVDKSRLVNSMPGSTVTFDIIAKNTGGAPANNVVITDPVPAGLTPLAASAKINGVSAAAGASVSGQTITINVGTVAAGTVMDVSFDSTVANADALGTTFVNTARVAADGMAQQTTLPAAVLIGTANVVYDGFAGQGSPVGGAVLTLMDAQGNLVPLSAPPQSIARLLPMSGTQGYLNNPYTTGPDGVYGFALQASRIAIGGSRFFLQIAAPGFLNRRLQLDITPNADGILYDVRTTAIDGEPLAQAGQYALTNTNVALSHVFGLFGNLPLFRAATINVTKTANVATASPGDRVDYTINFSNAIAQPVLNANIVDTMPTGLAYAPGTGKLDGAPVEPQINGRVLTWNLSSLAPGQNHVITYSGVIYPSVSAGTQLVNGVKVVGTAVGGAVSGNSNVTIIVTGGAFSDRRVVTGRVFLDTMGTGHFERGDNGLSGVHVFLEDGTYVVTDADGRFNFPALRPGMHVLRIDPDTLPANAMPYAHARMNSTRSTQRLLHGILDEATMEDVEFAVSPK